MVDELPVVARATKQADVELTAAAVNGDLSPMEADLRTEHTLLITDAQSLANRKLVDPQRIDAARSVQSYRQLIHSTLVLVALLRERWPAIQDHTPITKAAVDRAEEKATRMMTTLGERDQGTARGPEAELRLRALTDLTRRYDEIRRMVSYLRWHDGDAEEIAPSLYSGPQEPQGARRLDRHHAGHAGRARVERRGARGVADGRAHTRSRRLRG